MEKGKWNKYNIKSQKVPKGKEGSEYYGYLLIAYGEERANEIYKVFKYQITHGQEFFNK